MAACPLLSRYQGSNDNEDFGATIGDGDMFDPTFYRRWFNMGRQQPSSQQSAAGACPFSRWFTGDSQRPRQTGSTCPYQPQTGASQQTGTWPVSQQTSTCPVGQQPAVCPMRPQSGTSVTVNPDKFVIRLNTRNFTPQDITVKTEGSDVIIHGKHAEKSDGRGCHVQREFTRRYELPEDVEPETVKCELMPSGDLVIEATRKEAPKPQDKPVPIEVQHVPESDDEENDG